MNPIRWWYEFAVEMWAEEGPAWAGLMVIGGIVILGGTVVLAAYAVYGLYVGLPWTLVIVPIGWAFLVFMRTVARDAERRKANR